MFKLKALTNVQSGFGQKHLPNALNVNANENLFSTSSRTNDQQISRHLSFFADDDIICGN